MNSSIRKTWLLGSLLFLVSALITLFSYLNNTLLAGLIFSFFFASDFWAIRHLFIVIKELEKQTEMELKNILSPIVVIFGWMLYSLVQLMGVLFAFECLQIDVAYFKWVFPLVALKALWLIIQLGRSPLKFPLLSDKLRLVHWATGIISCYAGVSIVAFFLETFVPVPEWGIDLLSLSRFGIILASTFACLLPLFFYQKLKASWLRKERIGDESL